MKKIKFSKLKLFIIIISIFLLGLSVSLVAFDFWRYTPLSTSISISKLDKLSKNSISCRQDCNYLINYFLKIICDRNSISQKNVTKIIKILNSPPPDTPFKLALINFLKSNYCLQKHQNLSLALKQTNISNYLNYIDKSSINISEKNSMIENLKKIIEDKDLPLTQRKVAFRSLWTVFNNINLFDFYLKIINSTESDTIILEAIKGISNIDDKAKVFKLSDLNLYREPLSRKNTELEKAILFLVREYSEIYGPEVKSWLSKQTISPVNMRLYGELFK